MEIQGGLLGLWTGLIPRRIDAGSAGGGLDQPARRSARAWAATLPHAAWPGEYGSPQNIDWSPDGLQLVFGYSAIYNTGGMGVVDVASGKVVTSFGTQNMIEKVDWSPTRPLIALAANTRLLTGDYGLLYIHDTTTKENRWVPLASDRIENLVWSPDGTLLAVSCFYPGRVTLWRLTP